MEKQFTPGNYSEITICIGNGFVQFFIYGCPFYDFLCTNWYPYYQNLMPLKRWFTPEMADFITSNIQPV